MRSFLTLALVLMPVVAHAQTLGAGYPNPGSTGSPYALNNVNPSAGVTTPGGTYPSVTQSPSQFSSTGTNALYGNPGSSYTPELPNNVYVQDLPLKAAPEPQGAAERDAQP